MNAQPVTTIGSLPLGRSFHSLPHPAKLMPAFLGMPFPVLLDGAMPGAAGSRFSYLSADPFLVARSRGSRVSLLRHGVLEETEGDPWAVMKALLRDYRVESRPGLPPFQGGVIGYWSYDLGRHLGAAALALGGRSRPA